MNDAEDIFNNQDSLEFTELVNDEHFENLIEQKFWEKSKTFYLTTFHEDNLNQILSKYDFNCFEDLIIKAEILKP